MLQICRIHGVSLEPEYKHGDFVVVSKVPMLLRGIQVGNVIAFRQPGYGLLVKRVERVAGEDVFVVGTHPESVDSRVFGAVRRGDVLGKVMFHVAR